MFNWSAVSGIIDVYRAIDDYIIKKEHIPSTLSHGEKVLTTSISPPVQERQEQAEPYQTLLGRRHKILREDILQLNPRELSDFYGFEKVRQLEDCEAGLDEFPTEAIKRLEEFFFVRSKYLQEGKTPIFKSFVKEDCQHFLNEGFRPYFLCGPSFQEGQKDGHAYLVFCKEEEGYWRMIQADTVDGFYSNGGGAFIIFNLINSMVDLGMSFNWALCLDVSEEEWEKLRNRCWYVKGMSGYRPGNNKATHIYQCRFLRAEYRANARNKKFYLP